MIGFFEGNCCIFTCFVQNESLSSWMSTHIICNIINVILDDYPTIFIGVVFGNFFDGEIVFQRMNKIFLNRFFSLSKFSFLLLQHYSIVFCVNRSLNLSNSPCVSKTDSIRGMLLIIKRF